MKVVWVLDNIENSKYFYGRLGILMLITSVSLWKRNHREDTCVLYADDLTIDTLGNLKLLDFWDRVKPIPNPKRINKNIFWAASKLQVLSEIQEPIILMDNDTHVYKPIKHLLDLDKYYVTNFEIGRGFYPTLIDPYISKLSYRPRWETDSVNVSFLNLPEPEFTRNYANLSLQLMEELTELKAPNSQYLIFAEQLLLKHLLTREDKQYKSVIATYWDCKESTWIEDHKEGIWRIKEAGLFFKHYGPSKRHILDNTHNEDYNREIAHLRNCINFPSLDLSKISRR